MLDRALSGLVWAAVVACALALGSVLGDTIMGGWSRLSLSLLVEPVSDAGRQGGLAPVIASTLAILAVCLAAAVPLGVGAGAFLAEQRGAWTRPVRLSLEVLAGVPSIVFGLFGNAFFCKALGLGFSIVSGGLTLACMVVPILVKSTEQGLRAVPESYRLGAAALGLGQADYFGRVALPVAAPAIAVGLVLGVGRALAETAALIFTSGYVDRWPGSLMDSGRALSIHVYDLASNVPGGEPSAHASATVLLAAVVSINAVVWQLGRWARR